MLSYRVISFDKAPKLQDLETPVPRSGEVRIRTAAAAVNFSDLLLLKGRYQDTPPLPFTPGMELAGTIEACGPDVSQELKNKRVAVYSGQGGFAEQAIAPASRCLILPDNLSFTDAAGLQVAWGTSHIALTQRARLQPGETLVVLGASGGVGLSAVTLGKILGARVIAVARGEKKLEAARNAGADITIDSETDDIRDAVIAAGRADVVYDAVGGAQAEAAFRACNPGARFLLIGFASGDLPTFKPNHTLVKNIDLIGVNWSAYWKFAPQKVRESGAQILKWAAEGTISANVNHHFTLKDTDKALTLLKERKSTGKIVITPHPTEV